MPALNRATRGTSKAGAILTALILVAMLLPGAVLAAPGPTVLSISRVSSTPTSAAALSWTVTFSEAVTGVDVADFVTVPGGTLGGIPAVTGVTGTGANYTVTASTGSGSGTLGLNLVDDDSIINNATPTPVPLGGAGAANGNFTGEFYTIDRTAPTVTNVTSAKANGTYAAGAIIPITVTFSKSVVVTGIPRLTLETGASDAIVDYSSGSGTANLTFTYTVAAGQTSTDLDYASTSALALNGGTIADAMGNPALLTLAAPGVAGSLGANKNIVVDTTLTVTINQASSQADPTKTSPINFAVVFSAAVSDFATVDVTLSGTAGATTATVTGSGTTYNVAVSGMTTSGTVIASIVEGVAHAGTSPNSASTSTDSTVTWDVTAPTVTVEQAVGQPDPTSATPINFTVVFSESVTGFATGDVTLSGTAGATTATVTGSGSTYNVAVSGMTTNGTVVASVAASKAVDLIGNLNVASTSSDNSVTYDTALSVTINQASGQADPASVSPVNFTVVFSESVTGFATGDVTLSGTAGATTATVTGSGSTYNVAVSGMTTSGTIIASIAADRAHATIGGHPNRVSTSTDNSVTYVLPSKLTFTSQPGTSTKDVAFPIQPVVAIQNAAGTTATNVPATTVTLAIGTNPAAGTLTCTNGLTRTTVAGVATFSGCRINNAGVGYTLTATATSLTGATSTAFTVAAPAAQIALTTSSSVITWGNGIVLTTQFGVNGGSKTFQLQGNARRRHLGADRDPHDQFGRVVLVPVPPGHQPVLPGRLCRDPGPPGGQQRHRPNGRPADRPHATDEWGRGQVDRAQHVHHVHHDRPARSTRAGAGGGQLLLLPPVRRLVRAQGQAGCPGRRRRQGPNHLQVHLARPVVRPLGREPHALQRQQRSDSEGALHRPLTPPSSDETRSQARPRTA